MNELKIASIASQIEERLSSHPAFTVKGKKETIKSRICESIQADLKKEQAIDIEAEKMMLASIGNNPDNVDQHKLFLMIKKRLAEQKGFPL